MEADTPPKNKVSPNALVNPYPTTFHLSKPNKTKAVITPEIEKRKALVGSITPNTNGIKGINPKNRNDTNVAKAEKTGLLSPGLGIP